MPYRPTSNFRESLQLNEIPDATPESAGMMSAADKAKLIELSEAANRQMNQVDVPADVPAVNRTPPPKRRRRPAQVRRTAPPGERAIAPVCAVRCKFSFLFFKLDVRIDILV